MPRLSRRRILSDLSFDAHMNVDEPNSSVVVSRDGGDEYCFSFILLTVVFFATCSDLMMSTGVNVITPAFAAAGVSLPLPISR